HAVRDVASAIASDLRLGELDVYLSTAAPEVLAIELGEPPSLVIGERLVAGAHEKELRFLVGRQLKMLQARLAVPLRLGADELGVLVGGLVRQCVPDSQPAGFSESQVASEAARLQRIVPRKLHQELSPFALECAAPDLDLRGLAVALVHSANRAGLLASGSF